MKIRNTEHREEVKLQITPMIDIVFQLLIFFIFTFKIVLPEGDFNIRMPSPAESQASVPSETPLLKVKLRAGPDRNLASLQLGDLAFSGDHPFAELQSHIRSIIGDDGGPGTSDQEVEIDADYNLRYRYVMDAITAITGYVDETGEKHKLVERVRFAPVEEEK